MSKTENLTLRRSKRIQQKHSKNEQKKNRKINLEEDTQQKKNRKINLEEDTQYFSQAFQLSDGSIQIAHLKKVTVRGVPVEASAAESEELEKNGSVMPNTNYQRANQGSAVFQNKRLQKLPEKPNRKPRKKDMPTLLSLKPKKPVKPVAQRLDITEMPNESCSIIAQPCNSFPLSGELPAANTVNLRNSNCEDQGSHRHFASTSNSVPVLNQLSDRNNATEGHTSTTRHQCFTDQYENNLDNSQHRGSVNQFCEQTTQTTPIYYSVNSNRTPTMPQISSIDRNGTPGHVCHNMTHTEAAPSVLQTNQIQNTFSRPLFPSRQIPSLPQPCHSVLNPSIRPRGNVECCNHSRMSFGSNPITFHSHMSNCSKQPVCCCPECHNVHRANQILAVTHRCPPDLPSLPHIQQTNTLRRFVNYSNPSISNSLSSGQQTHQHQHSGNNNTHSPGQRQGMSAQGPSTSQVFNCNKHAPQSTQQQHTNSREPTQQHTVLLPFYGNTPIEIEIK